MFKLFILLEKIISLPRRGVTGFNKIPQFRPNHSKFDGSPIWHYIRHNHLLGTGNLCAKNYCCQKIRRPQIIAHSPHLNDCKSIPEPIS